MSSVESLRVTFTDVMLSHVEIKSYLSFDQTYKLREYKCSFTTLVPKELSLMSTTIVLFAYNMVKSGDRFALMHLESRAASSHLAAARTLSSALISRRVLRIDAYRRKHLHKSRRRPLAMSIRAPVHYLDGWID